MDGISNFFNVLAAILAVSAIFAFLALLNYAHDHKSADHTCTAPCKVALPKSGIAEDDVRFDYGGNTHTALVFIDRNH